MAVVIGALASGSGCKSDKQLCNDYTCATGEQLYSCKPTTGFRKYQCLSSETAANFWCQSIAGKPAVYVACNGYGDEVGDGDGDDTPETGVAPPAWNPSSSVTYDRASGHYLVDGSFVGMLEDDPGLILLDSARVAVSITGHYMLESVAQGDLAAALGLQSGDILMSVNRHDLSNIDNMVDAYDALAKDTSFTLAITRNGRRMELTYDVVE
jgi:hypothetical protein